MASTPDPKNIQGRLDQVFGAAEALRQYSLAQLAEDEKSDVDLLQEVRDDLAGEVGEDDPRVRALDRRIAGSTRFVDIAQEVAGGSIRKPNPDELKPPDKPKEPAPTGDWVVMGRVLDANERPVSGALVTLASDDQDLVRRFGEVRTGKDGRFEVRHAGKDMQDIFKRAPKARLIVTSPDGKLTDTSHEIQPAADQNHAFDIRLQPEKPAKGTRKQTGKKE
jgi:hypothetical protein